MSITPEEFIKKIRAAKTPAQEAAIIQTELSIIRSQFKQRDQQYVARNVAKIVYASMCGFSVAWGDMEIVNLCQSARSHAEKRLSYLALQIVPHDDTSYLQMASNTIKTDLESGSQYHASLALRALAAVGTPEMLVELSPTIQSLIKDMDSVYIRKQAMIVGLKIAQMSPDIGKVFIEPCIASLSDKSNSIPLSGVQLAIQLIKSVPEAVEKFTQAIPQIITLLQNLLKRQRGNDHEMGGIIDPVLQVQLLRLIRTLLEKSAYKLQGFPDTQVRECLLYAVSQTGRKGESASARASVQIEAALTLLALPAIEINENPEQNNGSECWAAAVESLVSCLGHKNHSVRYSALAAAGDAVRRAGCTHGVQRYQDIVFQCMSEDSLSLRRKALGLLVLVAQKETAMQLVNLLIGLIAKPVNDEGNNVNTQQVGSRYMLIKGALNLDIKTEIISSICFLTEVYCEDALSHFEVLLAAAYLTGMKVVNQEVLQQLINHVKREEQERKKMIQQVEAVVSEVLKSKEMLYNETLMCGALYLTGEYAEHLQNPEAILRLCEEVLKQEVVQSGAEMRYAVSAASKIYAKLANIREQSMRVLQGFLAARDPETQFRAYEYAAAAAKHPGLLGDVPATPKAQNNIKLVSYTQAKRVAQLLQAKTQNQPQNIVKTSQPVTQVPIAIPPQSQPQAVIINQQQPQVAAPVAQVPQIPAMQPQMQPVNQNNNNSIFSDLMQQNNVQQPQNTQPTAPPEQPQQSGQETLGDLFDSLASVQQVQQQVASKRIDHQNVFQDSKISVILNADITQLQAKYELFYSAISSEDIKIKPLYAAAKGATCQIEQLSRDVLNQTQPPAIQHVLVNGENLAIRIKLDYMDRAGNVTSNIIQFDPQK